MDLSKLTRQLDQAQKALARLDGPLTSVQFDPEEPASIHTAIQKVEAEIDRCVAPWRTNALVKQLADGMKQHFAEAIREKAAEARASKSIRKEVMDSSIFRQIEIVVNDLKRAESGSFDRHIKKLSRLLHGGDLQTITEELLELVDLQAWLKTGELTKGGMAGSASLEWPAHPHEELGITIALIDYFAGNPNQVLEFSHAFFYSGGKTTPSLQSMSAQVIVPFARDFINYVKEKTGENEPAHLPEQEVSSARKVFVVHGHDEAAKESVARFLEKIGFEAIILHEQASQGRTIIEKIEAHGDVGFAVVLLTPDDLGGNDGVSDQPRARQNVIMELGYFIGRLGRARVTALRKGGVEVPSDFGGVVYENFDGSGAWKQALGKELKAAGFEIDWNRIMQ